MPIESKPATGSSAAPQRRRGPVNSYTEWGPLQEVILGSHYNTSVGTLDTSMALLFHDNLQRLKRKYPDHHYEIRKEYIDEREEDVAGVTELLKSLGVTTWRPAPLESVCRVVTPRWEAVTKACDNPRDQVLIVGDRIIETPPCLRNRYFENDLLKPVLYDYFRRGARWSCAPRPMLAESSFDRSYAEPGWRGPQDAFEILFDAAQCLRFGRDILFNVATKNHELGFQWLARELGDEFRLHRVSLVDNHLDGAIMPLRPGKLLVTRRALPRVDELPSPLRGWDKLCMLDTDSTPYTEEELLLASERITVNVLSLDEERVLINDYATQTIRLLERHGFTPIPVRFRHSRIFGGGLHCVSLDIRRDEDLEDYFS